VKSTHRPSTPDSFKSLLGVPYEDKNCWDIVLDFYSLVFGITLDKFYEEAPDRKVAGQLVETNLDKFQLVAPEDRQFGDIILVRVFGVDCHTAVYLGKGEMLHTLEKTGCVVDKTLRWKHLIVGYYRVKNDSAS
jgi:cell wall-associated NlpC family hydrolase